MTQAPSIKEALEPVFSFLDELADNAKPGRREPLNSILIGGSAKLYAEGLRAALAALSPPAGEAPNMIEILPCPFCSSSNISDRHVRDGRQMFCVNCGASVAPTYHGPKGDTLERAKKSWNTRDFTSTLARPVNSLPSDETRPAVQKARAMLALGVNIQATGEATNSIVTGLIKSLIDHIDEMEADLNIAIVVAKMAAKSATLSPPAGERREAIALAEMVYKAIKFADQAAGEGIHYSEPNLDPADILSDYAEAIGVDCWDGMAEAARDAILACGFVQDEAAIRADEREKCIHAIRNAPCPDADGHYTMTHDEAIAIIRSRDEGAEP